MRNFVPVTIFASLRKFCHRLLGETEMRKLIVFNHVTLDGYFVGASGDFSLGAHRQ
jgi:hypothetical protein